MEKIIQMLVSLLWDLAKPLIVKFLFEVVGEWINNFLDSRELAWA